MLDVQDGHGAHSLSPRQARIVAQLSRLVGSGAADFFRDACEMLVESPSHRSATHLISHALREVDSSLRYILEPRMVRNAPSPDKRGKKRKQQEENRGHLQSITAVCAALDLPTDNPVAVFWLQQAERDSATNLAGRAHRHALERARPLDRDFRNYFARFEDLFELVLGRFEEQYVRVFDRLDALLGSEPSIELAKELRQRLPSNPVTRQRFFGRAAAAWIGPLTEEGFFKFPPEPRLDPTDGSVEVPAWPESDYLARVAADVPGDVVRAVLEMAPTENSRVVWDLTRLALAIPPDEAATLAPKLVAAIPGPYGVIAADQIGELAVRLVEGGHPAAGMDLLRAVLGGFSDMSAASGRSYEHVQVLRESVPPVARIVGRPVLALLVDELNRAVTSPAKGRSRIWRPAIEPLRERRSDTRFPTPSSMSSSRSAPRCTTTASSRCGTPRVSLLSAGQTCCAGSGCTCYAFVVTTRLTWSRSVCWTRRWPSTTPSSGSTFCLPPPDTPGWSRPKSAACSTSSTENPTRRCGSSASAAKA